MRGHGTQLQMSDMGDPEAFTGVSHVTNIKPPAITRGTEDNSDHDTVAGKDYEADPLYDTGNVTLTIKYDPADATHTPLSDAALDGAVRNFKVVFTDASEWAFSGYVVNFDVQDVAQNQRTVTATVEIKPTGAMAIT